jgi:hypothetical protein
MLREGLAPLELGRAGSPESAEAKAHLTWKIPAHVQPMTAQLIHVLMKPTFYSMVSVPVGCQSPATVQLQLLRELRS